MGRNNIVNLFKNIINIASYEGIDSSIFSTEHFDQFKAIVFKYYYIHIIY